MGQLSGMAPALPSQSGWQQDGSERPLGAMALTAALFGASSLAVLGGALPLGLALALAGVVTATTWALRRAPASAVRRPHLGQELVRRASLGDPDLYLDLDAVEVNAVYRVDAELYAHLRGGIGQRVDPMTGDRRSIETSDVSLTWRCAGRRNAERLANQLNEWAANGTPLRLLAARGRCAVLIEDDRNWVSLPELRLAA